MNGDINERPNITIEACFCQDGDVSRQSQAGVDDHSQISDRWRAWQFLGVETDQRLLLELSDWVRSIQPDEFGYNVQSNN